MPKHERFDHERRALLGARGALAFAAALRPSRDLDERRELVAGPGPLAHDTVAERP